MTELCDIAFRYGTDKCPRVKHNYTPYYYNLFKRMRNKVKKVVELGVGVPERMQHCRFYHLGASLYMWRDFFPNAMVYGIDVQPSAIFYDERIHCFLGDERKEKTWKRVIKKAGSDIDIFIDDGSHQKEDQIFVAKTVMPMLDKNVIYIIEDVKFPTKITNALSDYGCETIKVSESYSDDKLLIVKHK